MKTRHEILSEIKNGNYEVRHEEECCCSIDWVMNGSQLTPDVGYSDCWHGNALYIGDTPIALDIFGEGRELLIPEIEFDDIPDDIWSEMSSDYSVNEEHRTKERKALVEFLDGKEKDGWKLMRDDLDGFANQYALYLIAPDADNLLDDGRVIEPGNMDELTVDEFVGDYYYDGDAMTDAFTSCEVVQ